jgi:hypothetical protein
MNVERGLQLGTFLRWGRKRIALLEVKEDVIDGEHDISGKTSNVCKVWFEISVE